MELQSSKLNKEMPGFSENENAKESSERNQPTKAEIQAWIISYLAELLEIESDEVDVKIPFERYSLDSSAAVGMTGDLQGWLGHEFDPTLVFDYPTIEALARHLSFLINT